MLLQAACTCDEKHRAVVIHVTTFVILSERSESKDLHLQDERSATSLGRRCRPETAERGVGMLHP
jgi:hypothetical protein